MVGPDGSAQRIDVFSWVGLIPLFACEIVDQRLLKAAPRFHAVMNAHRYGLFDGMYVSECPTKSNARGEHLLALVDGEKLKRVLQHLLSESEFLSEYGVRAVSRIHAERQDLGHVHGIGRALIEYVPGESTSGLFGGNSNWRGPIWMPTNYVLVQAIERYHRFLGDDFKVPVPCLGNQREANPFMGWRSIRLSSAHPEFFQTQLRAILRAGLFGEVSLLFPMISTLEEVQRLKRVVHRTRQTLQRQGIRFGENIPLGVMLEVPAAALCIDALLDEVDFVSIGSNDLIQYLMAADRDNPKVAHLCEPFSPALFRLLHQVIKACNERDKPVTLCGEMAGRPRCFLPLFGMGLRRFSMSPAFVPSIREVVRCTTQQLASETAQRVLGMKTVGEVRGYLTRKIKRICPNVTLLDMRK